MNKEFISVQEFENYLHPVYNQNFVFEGHRHQMWEINIIHRGEMEVIYGEHVISLKENMIMLFEPNVFHSNRIVSKNGVDKTVYQFLTDDIAVMDKPRVYLIDDYLRNLISLIKEECENGNFHEYYNKKVNIKAQKLLEIFLTKLQEEKIKKSFSNDKNAHIYEAAVKYMNANIKESLTIEDIAKSCCVSIAKLKRVFSEYAKVGVITFFNRIKLEKAMECLDNGKSVIETADFLNFSSQSYFSVWFKNLAGVSPIKYKYRTKDYLTNDVLIQDVIIK